MYNNLGETCSGVEGSQVPSASPPPRLEGIPSRILDRVPAQGSPFTAQINYFTAASFFIIAEEKWPNIENYQW
jgi:hypothetical protein